MLGFLLFPTERDGNLLLSAWAMNKSLPSEFYLISSFMQIFEQLP